MKIKFLIFMGIVFLEAQITASSDMKSCLDYWRDREEKSKLATERFIALRKKSNSLNAEQKIEEQKTEAASSSSNHLDLSDFVLVDDESFS